MSRTGLGLYELLVFSLVLQVGEIGRLPSLCLSVVWLFHQILSTGRKAFVLCLEVHRTEIYVCRPGGTRNSLCIQSRGFGRTVMHSLRPRGCLLFPLLQKLVKYNIRKHEQAEIVEMSSRKSDLSWAQYQLYCVTASFR